MELDEWYVLIYADVPKGRIALSSVAYNSVEEWEPISSRIILADLQVTIGKIIIIQVYALTEVSSKKFIIERIRKKS